MNVCLDKQGELAATNIMPIHGTVLQLIQKIEEFGHKL
jgi:hypothetical protein